MNAVLLIDFGSTYTKVTAVDLDSERVLGTARSFTTVQTDINEGLDVAVRALSSQTDDISYVSKLACSSAAGGLRMVTIGLVPDLTAEAGKRAALSAGAKVIKVYSYELTEAEFRELEETSPDIVLLTGGTDGGNKEVILHNAAMLAKVEGEFPVVVAGNKTAAHQVAAILHSGGKDVRVCENVMPEFNVLNIEPAKSMIRQIFLERIVRAKGLTQVQSLIEGIVMPTPSAVLNAARLLAEGTGSLPGLGDLMVIDPGGATTDVHSVASGHPSRSGVVLKGLPEPFVKRTVEGDLGVRYSASSVAEAVGMKTLARCSGLDEAVVTAGLDRLAASPEILPDENSNLRQIDYALGAMCVKLAVERHVGRLETAYTPFGVTYVQTGKDLTQVKTVIGTGGPIIGSRNSLEILRHAAFGGDDPMSLKPRNPAFFVDASYILAAMGLLAQKYPETALRILKKELKKL